MISGPAPTLHGVVLMLIDTNATPPRPVRHTSPRWHIPSAALIYFAGLAATILSGALAPVPGYVVLLGVCLFLGLGLSSLIPDSSGLNDHRQ